MTAQQEALAAIEYVGAEWVDDSEPDHLQGTAWLPGGVVWGVNGDHDFSIGINDRAGWDELLAAVRKGTDHCTALGCTICRDALG